MAMNAILPIDWAATPLRYTYQADKAMFVVMREVRLTLHEQERFRLHIERLTRKDSRALRSRI